MRGFTRVIVLVCGLTACFPPALPRQDVQDIAESDTPTDVVESDSIAQPDAEDTTSPQPECIEASDCDQADRCAGPPSCQAGRCVYDAPIQCISSQACITSVCEPTTGECVERPAPGGTPCEDGDLCTTGDACGEGGRAGQCVAGAPVVCERPNDCQRDGVCNPLSGACAHEPEPDGKLCNSGVSPHGERAPGTCSAGECDRLPIVRLGLNHSCALMADSQLRCWGFNAFGELGYGMTDRVGDGIGPHVRDVGPVDLADVVDFALGANITCAVTRDQKVRCWGDNTEGTLGYGDLVPRGGDPSTTPGKLIPLELPSDVVAVTASKAWPAVGGRIRSTCALSSLGEARCWGKSPVLGYPSTPEIGTPTGIPLVDLTPIALWLEDLPASMMAAGTSVQCALRSDGAIRCWGHTALIGVSDDPYSWGPRLGDDEPFVDAPMPALDEAAKDLCLSRNHVCALTVTGRLFCWGRGDQGRLGLGSILDEYEPTVPVSAGGVVSAVGCGTDHTCALVGNGVRCWGGNANGQLALGHTVNYPWQAGQLPSTLPLLSFGSPVMQLAVGAAHNCVVTRNGEVRCWGANGGGQLGVSHTDAIGDGPDEWPPAPIEFR